jgi:hypothetical protein
MQRGLRQLALAVVATLALPASAVEVQPLIEGTANYTDNLFSQSQDGEEDFFFSIGPGMAVSDEVGRLTWRLAYNPSYLFYVNFDDLNGWDHDAAGEASWKITPRTTVRVSNDFIHANSIARLNEASDVAGSPVNIDVIGVRGFRQEFNQNTATIGLQQALGPRTFLDASYTNYILDFEEKGRIDRANQYAGLGLNYLIRRNLRTGMRLSWSETKQKPADLPDRTGNTYNLSVTANWTPSPRTTLLASAGPALVKNDATNTSFTNPEVPRYPVQVRRGGLFFTRLTTCPQLDDGTFYLGGGCDASVFPAVANALDNVPQTGTAGSIDDENLTYFADVSFSQGWEDWTLNLRYRRSEDQGGNVGVSGVVNLGSVRLDYEPAPRWRLALSAAYTLQESTTDTVVNVLTLTEAIAVPGAGLGVAQSTSRRLIRVTGKREVRTFRTFFQARYQLTERVRLSAIFLWTDQEREFDGTRTGGYDRFRTVLGITYQFAPFVF